MYCTSRASNDYHPVGWSLVIGRRSRRRRRKNWNKWKIHKEIKTSSFFLPFFHAKFAMAKWKKKLLGKVFQIWWSGWYHFNCMEMRDDVEKVEILKSKLEIQMKWCDTFMFMKNHWCSYNVRTHTNTYNETSCAKKQKKIILNWWWIGTFRGLKLLFEIKNSLDKNVCFIVVEKIIYK